MDFIRNKNINSIIYIFLINFLFLGFSGKKTGSLSNLHAGETEKKEPIASYEEYWLFYDELKLGILNIRTIRPFYMKERFIKRERDVDDLDESPYRISILPPILDIVKTRSIKSYSSFQIFDYTMRLGVSGKEKGEIMDSDFAIFPIILSGSGKSKRDNYFAIFPFGGTIKGKLGMDYIHFVLFPIYVNYGYKRTKYDATSIFWPFFLMGKGYNRYEFRLFPFYSYSFEKENFRRYRILWPLFYYEENFLGSTSPQQVVMLLPLFGVKQRFRSKSYTVFWPFFSWGRDDYRGTSEYNILWPIIQWADSRDPYMYKRYFFPFFGIYKFRNKRSIYVSPLYFEMKSYTKKMLTRQSFLIPMIWISQKFRPAPRSKDAIRETSFYFKIWPLFHYYNDKEDGYFQVNIFSPLWFRRENSVETLYSPFWSIFTMKEVTYYKLSPEEREYYRSNFLDKGEMALVEDKSVRFKYLSLLFRLYSQWEIRDTFHWQIPLLVNYTSKEDAGYKLQFFYGLFEYNSLDTTDDKKPFFRLFWGLEI